MEKKGLVLTKKDLLELKEEKKRNFEARLEFIDLYCEWLKKTPNKVWSRQQNSLSSRA
ncbi:hypothetical protein HY993_04270 [Candidatus Micrarchaeota archaeon]|nr:hypothetical protein [Candidatus Micrarchaeota archaeon]